MICPFCGDEMEHWNQGIYECKDCNIMIPDDFVTESQVYGNDCPSGRCEP